MLVIIAGVLVVCVAVVLLAVLLLLSGGDSSMAPYPEESEVAAPPPTASNTAQLAATGVAPSTPDAPERVLRVAAGTTVSEESVLGEMEEESPRLGSSGGQRRGG